MASCVTVCPTQAIMVGDMNDPSSRVAEMVHRQPVAVRRPEKETQPKLFYRGAHQATLDPLAARRPEGGLFMWGQQREGGDHVVSGQPAAAGGHAPGNSSAAAVLSYDVPHKAPWDWRVSLYTLTKGIAAGAYLVPALLVAFGLLETSSSLWMWTAPLLAMVFLAVTGLLLISDLEHPERFYYIFTRPQWQSWLVKGGFIIAGYGAVLTGHLVASFLGSNLHLALAWLGLPLALMTAVYTAYLFAQAKARDLWQSPLLPPHLAVQAVLAGSAALLPFAEGEAAGILLRALAASSLLHLACVWGESTLTHVTAHARLAAWEMIRGRFRSFFWAGIVLVAAAVAAPWIGLAAAPLALAGLLAFEHAYVQAGQAVPLA